MLALFPGQKLEEGNLSVVTLAIRTEHDMSTWSDQVEEERERLTEHLVITAKEVCGQLKEEVGRLQTKSYIFHPVNNIIT